MNDWALYLGVAALLCAACSLLGAGLAHLWGVDPSRETPGARQKGAVRRLLLGRTGGFFSALPAALWMSAAAGEAWGREAGTAICAVYALVCALLAFLTVFTCVRREAKDMAQVYGEELFPAAKKLRHALGMLAAVFSAGAMLMSLLREGQVDVSNGHLFLFAVALWPMMSMQFAAGFAGAIRNERNMLSAAAGGPVCAALAAILSLLPGAGLVLSDTMRLVLLAGIWLIWAAAWFALCRMGARALHGLLERPLERKKRSMLPHTLACMLLSAALALYAGAWQFILAAALCVLCVFTDASVCLAWLRRIGRGLFSRN